MPYPAPSGTALAERPDALPVPESLRRNLRFTRGEGADAWIELSVGVAHDLAALWGVVPETILEGGAMSVVLRCRDAAGALSVLKIPGSREMGVAESSALAAWTSGALPRLIAADPETGAFLMEHIAAGGQPPTPAGITDLLAGLHQPVTGGLHPLDRILQDRIKGATKRFSAPERSGELDDLVTATGLIARLQATADPVMVHGDFQAKNVLHGLSGPVAIDPLPAAGDPLSDLGLWIGAGSAGPRAAALWTYTGFSSTPHRLLAWTWALAVVEYRPGTAGDEDAAEFIDGHRRSAAAYLT